MDRYYSLTSECSSAPSSFPTIYRLVAQTSPKPITPSEPPEDDSKMLPYVHAVLTSLEVRGIGGRTSFGERVEDAAKWDCYWSEHCSCGPVAGVLVVGALVVGALLVGALLVGALLIGALRRGASSCVSVQRLSHSDVTHNNVTDTSSPSLTLTTQR